MKEKDIPSLSGDAVKIGSVAEVLYIKTGARHRYKIVTTFPVGDEEATIHSPVGSALLGKKAGEKTTMNLKDGSIQLKILKVY